MISIKGLNKVELLHILYFIALPRGSKSILTVSLRSCMLHLALTGGKVSYLNGKKLMVDLSGDEFDPTDYNKINGEKLGESCVQHLRIHDKD